MNSEESKSRFISSSEAKEKNRSAYYKLLESAREGNRVCIDIDFLGSGWCN